MNNRLIITCFFFMSVALFYGCANGVFGKKTNTNIKALNATLNDSREEILAYLKDSLGKTTHDISIGILQGTIGYLDDEKNRDAFAGFIDSVIHHSVGRTRIELITLRDSLLSPYFITQTKTLLRGVVNELVVNPSENLLTFVLSNHTQGQLNSLLRMIIPALINDDAIHQIDELRNVLVGYKMRKDVASILDTSLVVLNYRLYNNIRPTLDSIVSQNVRTISSESQDFITRNARPIMWSLIATAIVIGLIVFFVQQNRVNQKKKLAYYLTAEIENFRNVDEAKFHVLTKNIRDTMISHRLEGDLSKMLVDEGINK